MKIVLNPLNYVEKSTYKGQTFTKPSQTIPDQTMSLRTILDRYARGLPINGVTSPPLFEGEDMLGLDIRTMDLSEQMDYLRENAQKLLDMQAAADKQRKQKAKDAAKAALIAEIEAEKAQISTNIT